MDNLHSIWAVFLICTSVLKILGRVDRHWDVKKYLFWQERVGTAVLILNITLISASAYPQTHFQQSQSHINTSARGAGTLLNCHCSFLTWFSTGEWLFYQLAFLTQKVGTFEWFVSFSYRTFVCRGLKTETWRHHVKKQQPNTYSIRSCTGFSIGKTCSQS